MGGGLFEGRGEFLVGTDCRQCHVQCPSIRVLLDVHDGRQRMVGTSSLLGRGAAIDGRAHQGVAELDPGMDHQESLVHCRFNGAGRETEILCGKTKRIGIPLRVCRGDEQDRLRVGWQRPDLAQEPGLDQVTDGQGVGQRSVIQEVFGRQLAAQLHEGQRISPGDER